MGTVPNLAGLGADPGDGLATTTASSEATVELDRIAQHFGRDWVLRGASLRIEAGCIVALLGRNGSGKTTLLRILATLVRPTRGVGSVFGHSLRDEPAAVRAHTGLLGHAPAVYGELTAEENLRFAARMLQLEDDAELRRRLLEEVGLERYRHERTRGFSAGMQRRLALARLMLRPPRLLLLDEPHAAFDNEGVGLVHDLARTIRAGGGVALVATHDPQRANGLFDGMLLLEDGVLVETEARSGRGR